MENYMTVANAHKINWAEAKFCTVELCWGGTCDKQDSKARQGREAPKLTSVKIIFFHLPLNYNTGVLWHLHDVEIVDMQIFFFLHDREKVFSTEAVPAHRCYSYFGTVYYFSLSIIYILPMCNVHTYSISKKWSKIFYSVQKNEKNPGEMLPLQNHF